MRQKKRLFNAHFAYVLSLLTAGFSALVGCGDGKIARYPVTGIVMVDSQPAEGAMVMFCPVDGPAEFMKERPIGWTDASGKYALRTFEPGDGAPAGEYKVMVRWMTPTGQASAADEARQGGGAAYDRLRNRYFNPETSGLTATVAEAPTDIAPFQLSTK